MSLAIKDGYFTWNKGERFSLTPFFTTAELACPCKFPSCVEQRISQDLVRRLEKLREFVLVPIRINSGYRCPKQQDYLTRQGFPTAAGTSQHELGNAADISVYDMDGRVLAEHARSEFKAIGTARTWIHVDIRDDKTRRWDYDSVK